jgi:hypothetical protein
LKNTKTKSAGGVTQGVENLNSQAQTLSSNPNTAKTSDLKVIISKPMIRMTKIAQYGPQGLHCPKPKVVSLTCHVIQTLVMRHPLRGGRER